MELLSSVETFVLWHRYGPEPKTLQTIAEMCHTKRELIRQIASQASMKVARQYASEMTEPPKLA